MSTLYRYKDVHHGIFRLSWHCAPPCEQHPSGGKQHCVSLRTTNKAQARWLQAAKDKELERQRVAAKYVAPATETAAGATIDEAVDGSCVYFIQAVAGGLIKIGHTNNLRIRLQKIRLMNAAPLTLLGTLLGTFETEQALHLKFSAARAHGEWFQLTDDLLAFLLDQGITPMVRP